MKQSPEQILETQLNFDLLIASIYYLMTRYAQSPDTNVSNAICEHLKMLAEHPDCHSAILQNAGESLSMQWQRYLDHNVQEQNKSVRTFSVNPRDCMH